MKYTMKNWGEDEVVDVYVQIVYDEDYPDKVEIHLTDDRGVILEGEQFDIDKFINHVMEFYFNERN